ncbi:hypothetical protein OsJ_14771 [Oryza sativa Japonica Group]|uniref:Uncharacterized protein n=1 Tax=Oryza sativa subsp. japonica TaxID=39947 RepID=B9FF48_ORYSJ|nr:hypothetical protein OsJ_14771 [Oryza sativa Japonica Group]
MKKQAAAARCNALFVDRFEKIMMYPLVASLEYIFCFGGWTASCVVFFHLIVSFYGTEMTENLCSCDGMTAEEAAAMRGVEACMLLSCAAQMAAAAAAMALTTATGNLGAAVTARARRPPRVGVGGTGGGRPHPVAVVRLPPVPAGAPVLPLLRRAQEGRRRRRGPGIRHAGVRLRRAGLARRRPRRRSRVGRVTSTDRSIDQ